MRCKHHPCVQGSNGVCASCLQERLSAVLAAQAKESSESGNDHREPDPTSPPQPPEASFPRSVSPNACRRSATEKWHLFYSTPQVGPTSSDMEQAPTPEKKKKIGRFLSFSSLFRAFKSAGKDKKERDSSRAPIAPSSSWISAFRKKKSRLFSLDDEISAAGVRNSRATDRGLSPSTSRDEEGDGSPAAGSENQSESWQKPAAVTAATTQRKRTGPQNGKSGSGFSFCLSPLVWASPNRHHRHDSGFSGDLRGGNRQGRSTAPTTLCTNRSRKLADIGRYP